MAAETQDEKSATLHRLHAHARPAMFYIHLVQMSKLSATNMFTSESFSMGDEHFVLMCKHNN